MKGWTDIDLKSEFKKNKLWKKKEGIFFFKSEKIIDKKKESRNR